MSDPDRHIELEGRQIAYRLKRSARRTIGLKIDADGLTITLPRLTPAREAERIMREKSGWILPRLEKHAARRRPELTGADGQGVGYLGETLRLTVTAHAKARTALSLEAGHLAVRVDERLSGALRDATVLRAVRRWRREEAARLMTPRIAHYAKALGQPVPPVKVREQASRWGSCASDGTIRMNARLIAFAPELIDYVCAHEACHLIEMNHSKRFHDLLDQILPGHRALRRALRDAAMPGDDY